MKLKTILLWVTGTIAVIFVIACACYIFYVKPFMTEMMVMHTIPFDKQLTLVTGGGGNSGILTSDSLVLVVDTKMGDAAQPFYEQVKQIAGNRPIVVINTHLHPDHSSGNHFFAGQTIIAGNYDKDFWIKDAGEQNLPTQWVKDSIVLKVGDETVTILNIGFSAHTQDDVIIYLNNRKLIFTGDLVLNKQSPALFQKYNASSTGYLRSFDLMEKRFDIKTVVPGHGNVGGTEVIDNFRKFFTDMQTAAADASKKDEIIAKYKDWGQIPFVMSPGAAVKYIQKETGK